MSPIPTALLIAVAGLRTACDRTQLAPKVIEADGSRAIVLLVLTLALCCVGARPAIGTEAGGAQVAKRSLYVEPPVDHSGKALDNDVLSSLHEALESELGKGGRNLSTKADAQALVEVEIIDFHMRNQASRWMLGAMSGKDFIKSKISLVEPGTGAILLSFEVTTSTANQWRGQNSIARLHAEEIAKALAQRTNQG
jgi:hypothetical protein